MAPISRRRFLSSIGGVAAGAVVLQVPDVLYRSPWTEAAAAQTAPTVQATFTALVEAVTTVPDEASAAWIIAEFDKALPPLPAGTPSAAVAAVLDAYAVDGGHGPTFATAAPEGRSAVLRALVLDPDPAMRQLANQILPFASFTYWSDATLDEPARPGGPRLPQWDQIGWPGPSHGYLDTYRDDAPEGFRAHG